MGHKAAVRLAQILANRSKTALEEAVLLTSEQLGFRYFMFCGQFSRPRGATHEIRFDNFPVHWHRYCAERGRDLLPGPLRRLGLQEVTPLPWRKIATRYGSAFAKASEFGLVTGVSCSVHGPRGQWSLTSFALARGGSAAERHILTTLPDCQLVACTIHYAAARVARRGVDRLGAPRELDDARNRLLSDRESQCLILSARGKTTSEIGQALQISERTVAFHLSNLRRKLGAANSRHAVARAFSLKLIAAGS
jgi:DNA-binding CsgD family transcriptional regulator